MFSVAFVDRKLTVSQLPPVRCPRSATPTSDRQLEERLGAKAREVGTCGTYAMPMI